MDLLNNREASNTNDLLEKRFIAHILREEAKELDQNQLKLMISRGFKTTQFFNNRGFNVVDDNKLQYTHPLELRFIDMKSRTSKSGVKSKKKSYPVHNKPLFAMMNNIIRRLRFEYTDKMKQMLATNHNIKI